MGTSQGEGSRLPALNLTQPSELKVLLERHGFAPTKRFGQHFLVSEHVVSRIIEQVLACEAALEIGPGPGVLTSTLSMHIPVIALEVDRRAISVLSESAPRATVLEQDALKCDLNEHLATLPENRAIVSNMPYNLTGPLLSRITHARAGFRRAVLMMQREVAQKIQAKPGSSEIGSISVFLQSRFAIRHVVEAGPGCFWPPPKVFSDVLLFEPLDLSWPPELDKWHEMVVRTGFTQPRKTLANNLSKLLPGVAGLLDEIGLPMQARPHQLTLQDWQRLSEAMDAARR